MTQCKSVRQEGMSNYTKHELYTTWRMMNYRCFSEVHGSFATYGGAGITVCERWRWDNVLGFVNFVNDMGERPEKHTLDREDPDGIYEPSNCRWADKKTQQNNFRRKKNTESGYLGVIKGKNKKWKAHITLNDVMVTINFFDTLEDAIAAREQALSWKVEFGDAVALAKIEENIARLDNGKRPYNGKTSKYYGVSWNKQRSCWRAQISRRDENGVLKHVTLGRHEDEESARKAVEDYLKGTTDANSI